MGFTAVREHELSRVQVALQAREDEIYLAAYLAVETPNGISVRLQGVEQVVAISSLPSTLIDASGDYAGVGNAWIQDGPLRKRITTSLNSYFPEIYPRASVLSILAMQNLLQGAVIDAEHAQPIYLKEQLEYK